VNVDVQLAPRFDAPPPFVRLAVHPLRWRLLRALAGSDLRVRELVARTGEPQNLVSYHLRLLRDGGLVTARRSSFDGRDSYYVLDLDRCAAALTETGAALHPGLAAAAPAFATAGESRPGVLFICTGNSARSPVAEALLRQRTGGMVAVASAGTRPREAMHPNAVRVLRQGFGIDISGQRPRPLEAATEGRFDRVITLCDRAREACAEFGTGPVRAHWSIPDPSPASGSDEASYPAFERMAAEIEARIRYLVPVLASGTNQEEGRP